MNLDWLAGMFEGEGTVTISSGGRRGYTVLIACLSNTDESIPREFHRRWGGSLRWTQPKSERARPALTWRAGSATAAAFLRDIQPHIQTKRVREKVQLALDYHASRSQGARRPGYREERWAFKRRMEHLNHRGVR